MFDQKEQFRQLLVIDDNEAIHEDFRKIFAPTKASDSLIELDELDSQMFGDEVVSHSRRDDFELSFASQGKEGFEILKAAAAEGRFFGAAFVDMRMPPGWDGVETIEHLWQVDPDLQVVICTAFSDRSWNEIIDKLGQTDKLLILKKPFDHIEVVQLATSLTQKRRLLQNSRQKFENLEGIVQQQDVELQKAHHDAETLIDSISSVLVSVDEDGIVSCWNPVASRLFEIPSTEAIGQRFEDLPVTWKDKSVVRSLFQTQTNNGQQTLELQFVDREGSIKTLDTTICPILDDPTSRARLMLASDVTIQKALQVQLDQAQRLESVGQLAAGVAHEINTPMQYIGDNVRFVAQSLNKLDPLLKCLPVLIDPDSTEDELEKALQLIPDTVKLSKVRSSLKQIPDALNDSIEGVEAVSKIVAAMKEFSHPGSDEKSQVCVNHVLNSTVTVAKNEWKYVADIDMNLEEELPQVAAFPSELNQAFLNIIVNASHAVGDRVRAGEFGKGWIRIQTRSENDGVVVTIHDNGGGIPKEAQERVFEPFFTTKAVGKGTGQGLAIAFSVIVKKHGGQISFEVEEGVGTTFKIKLPFLEPATKEQTESSQSSSETKVVQ